MPGDGTDDDKDKDDDKDTGEETINAATALWTRSKSELGDDDYKGFYKHVAHDFEDPLAWVHSRIEGNLEYSLLLFIPARVPFDLWDRNVRRGRKALRPAGVHHGRRRTPHARVPPGSCAE